MAEHAQTAQPTAQQQTPTARSHDPERSAAREPMVEVQRAFGNQAVQRWARTAGVQRLQRTCSCGSAAGGGGTCDECARKKDGTLQRSANASAAGSMAEGSAAPPIVHDVLAGAGRPLDGRTQTFMSERFGHDFSDVRVHTDAHASESARAVDAQAYTVGTNIAFASGRYAPDTDAGGRLLAHELAHVVQQRGMTPAMQHRLEVNDPGGADEAEAEAAARAVMSAEPIPTLGARPGSVLRRAPDVKTTFQTPSTAAKACLVHLHGDEATALASAKTLQGKYCANLVFVDNPGRRCITLEKGCTADPNRVFTSASPFTPTCPCPTPSATAKNDLDNFRKKLFSAIQECRGGKPTGADVTSGSLPTVAFHNNSDGGALSINAYSPGGSEAKNTDTDPARTGGGANPVVQTPDKAKIESDPDNFILTTTPGDFTSLSKKYNTVLQSVSPVDDGSLSVALKNARYANIEVEASGTKALATLQTQMGEDVLKQYGLSPGACQAGSGAVAPKQESGGSDTPAQDTPAQDPAAIKPAATTQDIEPMEREAQPAGSTRESAWKEGSKGCRAFVDLSDLDAAKKRWAGVISTMKVEDVIAWIVGMAKPPAAAIRESTTQMVCMLEAMQKAAKAKGSALKLRPIVDPSKGVKEYFESDYRNFSSQNTIWTEKFNFTRKKPFDRITPDAVAACPALKGQEGGKWNTGDATHRTCWAALSNDQKQKEILQASSAPGISRHHWGSEFDLFDTDPDKWKKGADHADEYSWLMRNASMYGFIQSFTATSAKGSGYMEERWHWSYYPVAQALLEFAKTIQGAPALDAFFRKSYAEQEKELSTFAEGEARDAELGGDDPDGRRKAARTIHSSLRRGLDKPALNKTLMEQWGDKPEYRFIRERWRDFVFNVNETPRF